MPKKNIYIDTDEIEEKVYAALIKQGYFMYENQLQAISHAVFDLLIDKDIVEEIEE